MQTLETLRQNWQDINWTIKDVSKTLLYLYNDRYHIWISENIFSTNGTINRNEYRLIGKTMDYLKQVATND